MEQIHTLLTLKRWIVFTTFGWFTGILLVLAFIAVGEIVPGMIGSFGGTVGIGLGMGTGVGLLQWLAIHHYLPVGRRWIWFSVLGFSLGYLVLGVVPTHVIPSVTAETVLPFATLLGAFMTGWLQYRFVLKNMMARSRRWIAHMMVGWFAAHLITTSIVLFNSMKLGDHIPGIIVFLFALLILTLGGPLLGYVTGLFIVPRTKPYQSSLQPASGTVES